MAPSRPQDSTNRYRPDQIRQIGTIRDASMLDDGATWSTFGSSEEIPALLKQRRETHEAGHHVVETDQFRRTVRAFQSKKDFGWLCIIVDAEVARA